MIVVGSGSVSETVSASFGPRFVIVTSNGTFDPGEALCGLLLLMARSATASTVVWTAEESFALFVSVDDVDTMAVFVYVSPLAALAGAVAATVKTADAPEASVAIVHETKAFVVWAIGVHVKAGPELCVSDTKVSFTGS